MILPFKMSISLQILEDEYIVADNSVTILFQLYLELYYKINWFIYMLDGCIVCLLLFLRPPMVRIVWLLLLI